MLLVWPFSSSFGQHPNFLRTPKNGTGDAGALWSFKSLLHIIGSTHTFFPCTTAGRSLSWTEILLADCLHLGGSNPSQYSFAYWPGREKFAKQTRARIISPRWGKKRLLSRTQGERNTKRAELYLPVSRTPKASYSQLLRNMCTKALFNSHHINSVNTKKNVTKLFV